MTAQEQILIFIDECLEGSDCFLVEFKVKPTNNYKIYIDSDSGFTLEKCISINRRLRKMVEESGLYPDGDCSLEVSSPGVDTPLKLKRQFVKNIGRKLEIVLHDEEADGIIAKLIGVEDDTLHLESIPKVLKGRKTTEEPTKMDLDINDVKTAMVCIEF